jgi:glucose-6-phosphate 1-epimerase
MNSLTIDGLNSRYGAPGRIVFHAGFAGRPNVVLANRYGTAEVALLGGTTLSYRPTGHGPVLFRPAKADADYRRGERPHGGAPVCWPQFGNRLSKDLPKHGFASVLVFDVRGTEYSEDITEVTLGVKSGEETRRLWPHDFDLELKVSVSMKLNLTLTTRNTGDAPFAFSAAFHPYFLLRDRDGATVRGLDGCAFTDGTTPELRRGELTGDLKLDFAPDHIFDLPAKPKHEFAILDPGLRRAIAVASTGNGSAVVWNPGEGAALADLAADDWRKFVCVEPVTDWPGGRSLAPGEKHVLAAAIQAHLEGGADFSDRQ